MSAIERLKELKPLKAALSNLKTANGAVARIKASKQVIVELDKLGLYDKTPPHTVTTEGPFLPSGFDLIETWDSLNADQTFNKIVEAKDGNLKIAAAAYFAQELQGKAVKTKIDGDMVYVLLNSKAKGKMTSRANRAAIALSIPRIPEILMQGQVGNREELSKGRDDSFIAFYEFSKELEINGANYLARIKVGERSVGGTAAYHIGSSQLDGLNNEKNPPFVSRKLNKSDLDRPSMRHNDESAIIKSQFDKISQDVEGLVAFEIIMDSLEVESIESKSTMLIYGDVLVINDDQQVLLVQRTSSDDFKPNSWWIPGGKIEDGESNAEGASRELFEETGIKVSASQLKAIESKSLDNGGVSHRFSVSVANDIDVRLQKDELQSFAWVAPEDLEKYDLLGELADLKSLIEQSGYLLDGSDDENGGQPETDDSEFSDNPNDENYRYADTGYIAGSKKELAQQHIKSLAKDGIAVTVKDIDWDEIESDPLLAEDVITKSNVMGDFSYEALKSDGVEPGTAFLIQKVLASVATEPHWDILEFIKNTNAGYAVRRDVKRLAEFSNFVDTLGVAGQKKIFRKAYVVGVDSLKSRISKQKTPRELIAVLKEIGEELGGFDVTANESPEIQSLVIAADELYAELRSDNTKYQNEAIEGLRELSVMYPSKEEMTRWLNDKHPDKHFSFDYNKVYEAEKNQKWHELKNELAKLSSGSLFNAITTNMINQAWISLGPRFWAIVELTSGAFVKHANIAARGKYDDWALTIPPEKSPTEEKGGAEAGKKKSTFELIVADSIERIGGAEVNINSTEELKNSFGFRDIQSGNWVLKDKASAEFHVKNAAASMMDLSDIVGIDPKSLAFGGRLALAFGARGRKGALAHYEPVQRVINITKMKGGGSLGHEWFHAIDNILGEVLGVEAAIGKGVFLSASPEVLGESPLADAYKQLQKAMFEGDFYGYENFKITEEYVKLAVLNIDSERLSSTAKLIKENSAEEAIRKIDEMWDSPYGRKRGKRHIKWRNIAAAYHNQDKVGEVVGLRTGHKSSNFKVQSSMIDGTRAKHYWATTHEMSARAFQAYLEDSLKAQGRKNDYLSYGADNSLYGGQHNAYPDGDERKRINAAFDNLFKVIKEQKVFENATADEAMMDSIFGTSDHVELDDYFLCVD